MKRFPFHIKQKEMSAPKAEETEEEIRIRIRKKARRRKKHIRIAIVLLVIFTMIGAAVYTVFFQSNGEKEKYVYKATKVEFGDLQQGITESGTVELETSTQDFNVELESDDDDDDDDDDDESNYLKIEDIYIVQGQRIKEGDKVFKFTQKSVNSVRRKLEEEKADAELTLSQAKDNYELSALSAKQTLDESTENAKWADTKYNIDVSETTANIAKLQGEIATEKEAINQIEVALADSWEDFKELKDTYETYQRRIDSWDKENLFKYVPMWTKYLAAKEAYETEKESREDKRQSMVDKREDIANLQKDLAILQQQEGRDNLTAEQTHEKDSVSGNSAEDIYNYTVEILKENITTAQTDVDDATDNLQKFEDFVGEDGIVYADGSGIITELDYEAGDSLVSDSSLYTYAKDNSYTISIDVLEEDIPYVKVGDAVTVVFTAYPEKTYKGTISEITTTATSGDTIVSYPVSVKVSGDTSKLYGGMTGDVTFITDQIDQVNYVSRNAVNYDGDDAYVYVQNDSGEYVKKNVKVGFSDGVSVQITSGLSKGDAVYIASKVSSSQNEEELQNTEAVESTTEGGSGAANDSKTGEKGSESKAAE